MDLLENVVRRRTRLTERYKASAAHQSMTGYLDDWEKAYAVLGQRITELRALPQRAHVGEGGRSVAEQVTGAGADDWDWGDLTPPYATIVADPPWQYDEGFATAPGGRQPFREPIPYSTMTVAEIAAMPVADLTGDDCWLFLWTTNAYIFAAPQILTAWGFGYRQTLVWHKTGNPSPFGGSVAPNHAEFMIVAAHGSPRVRERLDTSVVAANKRSGGGRHSQKPPALLDAVERVAAGPYVELFARAPRLGWDSWGWGYEQEAVNAYR